jgi:hypothetical protein
MKNVAVAKASNRVARTCLFQSALRVLKSYQADYLIGV